MTDHQASPFSPLGPSDPTEVAGYTIRARIGAGGMGSVYLSYTRGGQPIALKVVRSEFAEDPEFRRRFEAEVQAARRVQGLFTVPVLDSNTEGSAPWLASAFVPGLSLDRVVRDHGPLPLQTVLLVVAGVAEALQSIHSAGIIHRDLKPGNVLLASDGPKVIDFGIARAADATPLTGSDVRIGTPSYMAPEQVTGSSATPAADVFTLGLIAHYAATGGHPFGDGQAHALMYRILNEPPDFTDAPEQLRDLLAACLVKAPEHRPAPAQVIEWCRTLAPNGTLQREENWLPAPVAAEVTHRSTAQPPAVPSAVGPPPPAGPPPTGLPPTAPPTTAPGIGVGTTPDTAVVTQRSSESVELSDDASRGAGRGRGRGRTIALVAATAVVAALGGGLVATQLGSDDTTDTASSSDDSGDSGSGTDDDSASDGPSDDAADDPDVEVDDDGDDSNDSPSADGPDRPVDDPDSDYELAEWDVDLAISAPDFVRDTHAFRNRCRNGNRTEVDLERLQVNHRSTVVGAPSGAKMNYIYCDESGLEDQGIEFSPELFVGTVNDPDITPEECYEAAHAGAMPRIIPVEDIWEDDTLQEDTGLCFDTPDNSVVLLWIDRVTVEEQNQDLRTYLTTATQWHQG